MSNFSWPVQFYWISVFRSKYFVQNCSLNDILNKDPCLQPKLYYTLLAFRAKLIALTGDIEKAFLQIVVHENQRDVIRCLWFKNLFNCEHTKIEVYRFTSLIFWASSSSFLLSATIRKLESVVSLINKSIKNL